jgi:XisH protein
MPARDRYHDQVKNALVKDGWTITQDPLRVKWGKKDLYIDLGAEHFLLAAEKDQRNLSGNCS